MRGVSSGGGRVVLVGPKGFFCSVSTGSKVIFLWKCCHIAAILLEMPSGNLDCDRGGDVIARSDAAAMFTLNK